MAGTSTTGTTTLQSNGTVTESGAGITAASLTLTATSAGSGAFLLNTVNNAVSGNLASTNQLDTLLFQNSGSFVDAGTSTANGTTRRWRRSATPALGCG